MLVASLLCMSICAANGASSQVVYEAPQIAPWPEDLSLPREGEPLNHRQSEAVLMRLLECERLPERCQFRLNRQAIDCEKRIQAAADACPDCTGFDTDSFLAGLGVGAGTLTVVILISIFAGQP